MALLQEKVEKSGEQQQEIMAVNDCIVTALITAIPIQVCSIGS